jgi:hypothetical protein
MYNFIQKYDDVVPCNHFYHKFKLNLNVLSFNILICDARGDQLKRSYGKLRSVIKSERGQEYPTNNKIKGMQSGLVTSGLRTAF